jgi:hypothetical protein
MDMSEAMQQHSASAPGSNSPTPHNITPRLKDSDNMVASQQSQGVSQPPPPPTLEHAFHVSVAPITQPLNGSPPADVVLIVSIGPVLFRNIN